MQKTHTPSEPWRIAVVWHTQELRAWRTFSGFCRWSDVTQTVTLRRFDASASAFERDVVRPLRAWRPHGLLLCLSHWGRLERLRRVLPGVPFVTTHSTPPALCDSSVIADSREFITLARDHFRKHGLRRVGLFCATKVPGVDRIALFRTIVPDGLTLVCSTNVDQGRLIASPQGVSAAHRWLRDIPKPVGVVTLEIGAAGWLLERCRHLGLRVPQEVQIIGVDDADACLASDPHLTSIDFPGERIGEVAMETLLRHLRREQPPPPPVVRVSGSVVIDRGSTGPVPVGQADMRRAMQMLDSLALKNTSVKKIVRMARLGRSSFYEQYRRATGGSPAQHLRQQRLQEACRLLRESPADMAKIAAACGFGSANYFARLFRRETGQTPTAYREKMKGR